MLFNSKEFLVFLPVVLIAYHFLRGRQRTIFLLFASYTFYAAWDPRFLALLVLSTVVDFALAQAIPGSVSGLRKVLVGASVVINLGILGVFKYFDFFLQSLQEGLDAIGVGALDSPVLGIVVPVGISFYTFQTMAYTIDVGRGRIEPCRDLVDFAVFVSYFPQLVAGPIERAERLLPQLRDPRRLDLERCRSGLALIVLGGFKKIVLGDALISPHVDNAFLDPGRHPPEFLLLAACLFSIQIYVDFSGYSDIARGVSRLLGVELMKNFEQPYLSRNIAEFWHRWHISLSTWLRDYLYIPLGGNRHGTGSTYRNLLLTMLLGGLWHGASLNFLIWGGCHGAALALHRMVARPKGNRREDAIRGSTEWLYALPKIALTNAFVVACWVFFRAEDPAVAWAFLRGVAGVAADPSSLAAGGAVVATYALGLVILDLASYRSRRHAFTEMWPAWVGASFNGVLVACIFAAWPTQHAPFIYFQF